VGLIAALGRGPVALDTAAFVYLIEEHPRYLGLVRELFGAVDRGQLRAVTSTLTLLELLGVPYRSGDLALAERYEAILGRSRGLRLVDLDRPLLRAAAQLRAAHRRLRTPDALQLATALAVGATAFVTNDRELPVIRGLRIVELDDHLAAS
jgi:predicted nucleic acid-binding protein